jgi:hypothetical protein
MYLPAKRPDRIVISTIEHLTSSQFTDLVSGAYREDTARRLPGERREVMVESSYTEELDFTGENTNHCPLF